AADDGGRQRRASQAGGRLGEVGRNRRRVRGRVGGQQERLAWRLGEVEVLVKAAQHRQRLPDVTTRAAAAVGLGGEPGAAEEVIFDELQVGVSAERLMVDVALLGVWGDDQRGDTEPVAVPVGSPGTDIVVKAAPVVPGRERWRWCPSSGSAWPH